ncbi:hypothetical protein HZS55_11710 [Halosimplex rubrum]|uniref:Uncharacterized protein n=2 Tax=Halosimplex TaxID=171163 RepID=A0A7D5TD52_9EURY|nr:MULTISPECIES: hypothetical protein [Halosimplex]QLH77921.1 hypothetical protein HZS55_11710 [Halosimplex rubrum]QLH82675.1 hypothetical protein HZS54_14050 [Halosimplex pelagicum]
MSETQRPTERGAEQCGTFETIDGDLVLYDRENANAWIQASYAIDFEDVRATGPAE